jgi:hypothetical protein
MPFLNSGKFLHYFAPPWSDFSHSLSCYHIVFIQGSVLPEASTEDHVIYPPPEKRGTTDKQYDSSTCHTSSSSIERIKLQLSAVESNNNWISVKLSMFPYN